MKASRGVRRRGGIFSRFKRDARGSAAVEFALLAPVLGFILVGAIDLGGVVFVKLGLENGVSSGSNYAIVNAAKVTAANGKNLATTIAILVADSGASDAATDTVVVNNGPTTTIVDNVATESGTLANADVCYCPTIASSAIVWGGPVTCGNTCAGGTKAGKFVSIAATRSYAPLFSNYGIVEDGSITVQALIQTQ